MNLISFLHPTNLASEKEKFFHSNTYNPKFEYNWNSKEVEEWLTRAPKYKKLVENILKQYASEIISNAEMIFQTKIDREVLCVAKKILKHIPKTLSTQTIEELVAAYTDAINFFDLSYTIELTDEQGFNVRPQPSKNRFLISKHINLQFFSIDGQVKHEMVHIIRHENGVFNGIEKKSGYLPTEEGTACYFQDYAGKDSEGSCFQHAAEYAVTEVALNGSLRDMIKYLCQLGFDKDLAWNRAVRHKYGFVDTSQPGDIMKPAMYFHFEQKIKDFPEQKKLSLLMGKISLSDLPQYSEYKGIIPKEKLTSYFKLSAK